MMINKPWSFFSSLDKPSITTLLGSWKEAFPKSGVFALVAEASKDNVSDIQLLCTQANIPLVGAIFPELIHAATFEREGLLLIRMDEMPEYILTQDIHSEKLLDQLSKQIAAKEAETGDHSLFLLFDAMVPNVASILDRLYLRLADSVQYSGVNAGSETFQPMPCLFDSEQTIGNGLLAMLMPDFGRHILSHGYPMPTEMTMATSSTGNCIENIDWQPAFEVYQQLAKDNYATDITAENFYEIAAHFPFGLVLGTGETLIRIPVGLSDEGSLFCVGEVPENSMLTIMHGSEEDLLASVEKFSQQIDETQIKGLTFYCAGRRMHLGVDGAGKELAVIKNQGDTLIGALSLGEIGMSVESTCPQFHNAALVYNPWWKK